MTVATIELLSTQDVADLLGITRSLVLRYIREKRLPAQRIGSQWVVERRDMDAFNAQPRRPGPPRKNF